jgi:hypothetical protein
LIIIIMFGEEYKLWSSSTWPQQYMNFGIVSVCRSTSRSRCLPSCLMQPTLASEFVPLFQNLTLEIILHGRVEEEATRSDVWWLSGVFLDRDCFSSAKNLLTDSAVLGYVCHGAGTTCRRFWNSVNPPSRTFWLAACPGDANFRCYYPIGSKIQTWLLMWTSAFSRGGVSL